eukprot:3722043-Pyramimonas_sp.AAC.1
MATVGTDYLSAVISGDYNLIWISTPGDWKLRMKLIMFGPPGYVWKLPPVRDTLEDLKVTVIRMRSCHFGIRFNMRSSGTYMQ